MGSQETPPAGAYVRSLAEEAKRLQQEARGALERGDYSRASALIGNAELLAEDVHDLVGAIERREMGALSPLAAYDVREAASPARGRLRLMPPPARWRIAIGATLAMSLALSEC